MVRSHTPELFQAAKRVLCICGDLNVTVPSWECYLGGSFSGATLVGEVQQ